MTVGLVIVSHSAQLAAGVGELAGQMAQGKTPIAAAGGGIGDVLGTSVEKITGAIQSVDGPDGVLVLLDLGSAVLSTEMALEMLTEVQRGRVRISTAPLVEGAVAAALEASLGHPLSAVQQAAENTASAQQLRLLKPLSQIAEEKEDKSPASPTAQQTGTIEVSLQLTNPTGLHARPASLFVQTAARFQARLRVAGHGKEADAGSIVGVLSLGLRQGDTLTLRATGSDDRAAIEALSELVHANFYETPTEPAAPPVVPQPAPSTPAPAEREAAVTWHTVRASDGVALGPAFLYTSGNVALSDIEHRTIAQEQVSDEQVRLRQALAGAADELHNLAAELQKSIGQEQAAIFDAQALMLQDPELMQVALQQIEQDRIDAASALAATAERYAADLASINDPLLAARAIDVRDAAGRAVSRLREQDSPRQELSALDHPVILVARSLAPSDTAQLPPAYVLGICTVEGGPTAHAAILARALSIPALSGLDEAALQLIHNGDELGLDADNGLLYYHPLPELRASLAQRVAARRQQQAELQASAQSAQSPILIDGRRIHLLANIGSEAEAEVARQWGAEGIGLLRTEFLFAKAANLPDEEEQRQVYVKVFRAFAGDGSLPSGPIVVRTLDAGADKPMPALNAILGPLHEENPALGLRGIRIHLAHEELLEQQLSALLRAAAETGIELHIMFPMITTVEELQAGRAVFRRVHEHLRSQGTALPARVAIGIMVEVPAAVIMAPELAALADFFSIGSNDLSQYTLAADRTNTTLTSLYDPRQPAVLRSIRQVAEAGRHAGKPVAVCGEMAGDPRLAPILVALGVEELSMAPTALPAVRSALARWSAQQLSALAENITRLQTIAEVEQARMDWQI